VVRELITVGDNDLFRVVDGGTFRLECVGIDKVLLVGEHKATVYITGYLPTALVLRELKEGDVLEVVNCRSKRCIAHFEILEVLERKIPDLVILAPDENQRLQLNLVLDCRAQIFGGYEKWVNS